MGESGEHPSDIEENERNRLILEWTFPWHIMEIMIGGKSAVDLNLLKIRNFAEATEFVRGYGLDLEGLEDRRMAHSLIIEALNFIEAMLMPREWEQGNRPPDDILLCDDPRLLLQWASDDHSTFGRRGAWACALLRVMHTISHVESVRYYASLDQVREQILGRFRKFVFMDAEARLWLGVPEQRIELFRIDWKNVKTRQSIILKLLHKRANIAETIHDLLGVRIVTRTREEVMLAVKYLRQFYMVTFANTNPSRVRNTLIDYPHFKEGIENLVERLTSRKIDTAAFKSRLAELATQDGPQWMENPHSAKEYKAVQLTCRQLVRLENPSLEWIQFMRRSLLAPNLSQAVRDDLRRFVEFVEARESVRKGLRYSEFFNFEVQIMDEQSYRDNSYGTASHDKYKQAQVKTARKRILFEILGVKNGGEEGASPS